MLLCGSPCPCRAQTHLPSSQSGLWFAWHHTQDTPRRHFATGACNGQLGIIGYLDGALCAVLALSLANDHIQEIDLIVNPDKLRGITPLT